MEFDRPMTFGETWMAIKGGDIGVICAFALECAIMLSPLLIVVGAWYAQT